MLLVVTSRPIRFTSTGGALLPLGEAITRLRIDVLAVGAEVSSVFDARVCKILGSEDNVFAGRASKETLSTPTTLASRALRLLLRSVRFAGVAPKEFRIV